MLLGAYLIKFVNPIYLQLVVAIFLVSNVPQLFISKKEQQKEEKPYPKYILGIVGFLAGFVSGITGAIGLLFNRFYLRYGLSKEEIVATRAANEIFLHFIKLIIYISLGLFSKTAIWLGVAIAVGSIISSYTVKFILPYLSEFLFKKIGYAAMVISGIALLISTGQKIIKQDHISLATTHNEATVKWRNSDLTLEFAIDEGLEVERPIPENELPDVLNAKYAALKPNYEKVMVEKVYRWGEDDSYEFYLIKDNRVEKLEFKIDD